MWCIDLPLSTAVSLDPGLYFIGSSLRIVVVRDLRSESPVSTHLAQLIRPFVARGGFVEPFRQGGRGLFYEAP